MVPDSDSSPFVSSQQTTEGELYAGTAQSSSCLTGQPVAYLLGLVSFLVCRETAIKQHSGLIVLSVTIATE